MLYTLILLHELRKTPIIFEILKFVMNINCHALPFAMQYFLEINTERSNKQRIHS